MWPEDGCAPRATGLQRLVFTVTPEHSRIWRIQPDEASRGHLTIGNRQRGSEKKSQTARHGRHARSRRGNTVWLLEGLEDRVLLAATTYTVNAINDTGAGSGTTGDLRYCITKANA